MIGTKILLAISKITVYRRSESVGQNTTYKALIVMMAAFCALCFRVSARAADDSVVKLYQTKCAACHGADGGGNTSVGKALKLKDFRDPDVQR